MYTHTHLHTKKEQQKDKLKMNKVLPYMGREGTVLEARLGNCENILHNYETKFNKKEKDNP